MRVAATLIAVAGVWWSGAFAAEEGAGGGTRVRSYHDVFGNLLHEGEYLDNALHGRAAWYYPNGQVRVEATFANGRISGQWTEYYENGQIRATGEGYTRDRVAADLFEGPYEPVRNGRWVVYHRNGNRYFEGTYVNGNLDGPAVWYYASGQVRIEATFEQGSLAGAWTAYHENGRVRATGEAFASRHGRNTPEDPLRTGKWAEYDPDGNLMFEGEYENGFLHGRAVQYFTNGQVRIEATFERGQPSGMWTEYYSNGQVRARGEAAGTGSSENGFSSPVRTGVWIEYYPHGTPFFVGTYIDGVLDGRIVEYYSNGRERIVAEFDEGTPVGAWTRYYDNGQVHQTGEVLGIMPGGHPYASPIRTGLWLTFGPDGALREAGRYENGALKARLPFTKDPVTGLNRLETIEPDGRRLVYMIGQSGIVAVGYEDPIGTIP